MALSTWTELKASIADWLHRADLTAVIPDFITLAEEQIARDLGDIPAMWGTGSSVALTSGTNAITLPADAMGVVAARVVSPTDYVGDLRLMTYAELVRTTGLDSNTTGAPEVLAMRGNDGGTAGQAKGIVWPTANQNYTIEVTYRAGLLALGSGQASNFILKRAPSIYLYGSLLQAVPYLRNDARISTWGQLYQRSIDQFKRQDWDGAVLLGTDLPASVMGGRSNILTG